MSSSLFEPVKTSSPLATHTPNRTPVSPAHSGSAFTPTKRLSFPTSGSIFGLPASSPTALGLGSSGLSPASGSAPPQLTAAPAAYFAAAAAAHFHHQRRLSNNNNNNDLSMGPISMK